MERKRICAASQHIGGANAIGPAIKQLVAEGKVDVVVVGHEFSEPVFNNMGIPFKTIQDFGLNDVSAESMKALLKRISPDLILTGTAGQEGKANDIIEHTLTLAARGLGIKSLAVLDYWSGYLPRFTDERTREKLGILPDRIAVMDEIAKKDMIAEGFPEERLIITGNPHFDGLAEKANRFPEARRQEIRRATGLSIKTIFFFAGNIFSTEEEKFGFWDMDVLSLIAGVLAELPDVGLVVRLHGRMSKEDQRGVQQVRDFIRGSGQRIAIDEDSEPTKSQTLALAADLTLVANSTIGIEAVLMARPCISLQPGLSVKDPLLISREGVVPVGYDAETCRNLLRKAADASWRQQVLKKYSGFATEGKATGRVVQLVYRSLSD